MTINNFTEFYNLVEKTTFSDFAGIKNCVTDFSNICNCKDKKDQKSKKGEECNRIYISIIHTCISNHKEFLRSVTSDPSITFIHSNQFHIGDISLL